MASVAALRAEGQRCTALGRVMRGRGQRHASRQPVRSTRCYSVSLPQVNTGCPTRNGSASGCAAVVGRQHRCGAL